MAFEKTREVVGLVREGLNIAGEIAGLVGLHDLQQIKESLGGNVGHVLKATVGKKGTIAEYNQAFLSLTQAKQDAIEEVITLMQPKGKEYEHFRINAVLLSGPDPADTIKLLDKIAGYPTAQEGYDYLKREHYLVKPTMVHGGPGNAAQSVSKNAKKAVKAIDADVKKAGIPKLARKLRRQAEAWAKK